MSAASVYFRDVDGNNLEVSTWEDVPEEHTTPIGGPHGFPVWEKLAHNWRRSEEHTSELQSLMRISYAVFCLKKKTQKSNKIHDVYTCEINQPHAGTPVQ